MRMIHGHEGKARSGGGDLSAKIAAAFPVLVAGVSTRAAKGGTVSGESADDLQEHVANGRRGKFYGFTREPKRSNQFGNEHFVLVILASQPKDLAAHSVTDIFERAVVVGDRVRNRLNRVGPFVSHACHSVSTASWSQA